jgi:NAD(P)H-dependent FMN reductase
MKLCIISGSVREENTTALLAQSFADIARGLNIETSQLALYPFLEMFTGTYIFLDSASSTQLMELEKMRDSSTLLFVVPTYYRSMPGALKNFFDLTRSPEVYAGKTIAFASSNHKNQDYGAQNAFAVIQGLLIFFKIHAVLVPEILIQHPLSIDMNEVSRFLETLRSLDNNSAITT